MGILLMYSTLFLPFSMAFIDGDLIEIKTILYFNCVLECLFILDFLIGFISAQENSSGDLEIRPKYIIKQYLSSGWFLIDFISKFITLHSGKAKQEQTKKILKRKAKSSKT